MILTNAVFAFVHKYRAERATDELRLLLPVLAPSAATVSAPVAAGRSRGYAAFDVFRHAHLGLVAQRARREAGRLIASRPNG